jgi:hypothetical protein
MMMGRLTLCLDLWRLSLISDLGDASTWGLARLGKEIEGVDERDAFQMYGLLPMCVSVFVYVQCIGSSEKAPQHTPLDSTSW